MSLSPGDNLDQGPNSDDEVLNIPVVPEGFDLKPFQEANNLVDLLNASVFNLVEDPQRADAVVWDFYGAMYALQRAVILEDEGKLKSADAVADFFRGRIRISAGMLRIDTTDRRFSYLVE